jgi:hypothetical protein
MLQECKRRLGLPLDSSGSGHDRRAPIWFILGGDPTASGLRCDR